MERAKIFDLMGELKLYGMKAAFDEIMVTAIKRQHEPQRIVGDLLTAEISEKQARPIKYQLTIAKLPLAKDIADFQFDGTPINQISPAAALSPSNATSCWSAVPAPARPIWPSPSPGAASAPVPADAFTTSSTSSTVSKARPVTDVRAGSPNI